MANWILKKKKANIEAMSKTLNITPILSQILANREINTKRKFREFINPSDSSQEDIRNMKDAKKAFEVVREAILNNDKIVIYGDYDVDGVMSSAILVKGLSALIGSVGYYIPLREEEGYGLNIGALEKILQSGCNLLILCDNGIAAYDEIKKAKEHGVKVIVIDHHEVPMNFDDVNAEIIPPADAVIDPKQKNCPYIFKQMCAAGLCYRFIKGFYENYNIEFTFDNEFIMLAAIATFCDVVDLIGDNRAIAHKGLEILNGKDIPNEGLKCLIAEKGYEGKYIDEFVIGYILGPCINASGRLESAAISVELMLSADTKKCKEYSTILNRLNEERKLITKAASDYILEDILNQKHCHKVIVAYNKDVHESVAGIVAGRIRERLYRPTIVITKSGNIAKGSGRSISSYNMFEALSCCKDLFLRFGGHAMAAGFSLEEDNIDELRNRLNDNCDLSDEDFQESIYVDFIIPLDCVTFKLYEEIRILRPFGKENKEPVFGSIEVLLYGIKLIEQKNTLILTFSTKNGRKIKGVCFGKNDYFKNIIREHYDEYDSEKIFAGLLNNLKIYLDILYYISINEYNNDVSLQLSIKDFRIPKTQQ